MLNNHLQKSSPKVCTHKTKFVEQIHRDDIKRNKSSGLISCLMTGVTGQSHATTEPTVFVRIGSSNEWTSMRQETSTS